MEVQSIIYTVPRSNTRQVLSYDREHTICVEGISELSNNLGMRCRLGPQRPMLVRRKGRDWIVPRWKAAARLQVIGKTYQCNFEVMARPVTTHVLLKNMMALGAELPWRCSGMPVLNALQEPDYRFHTLSLNDYLERLNKEPDRTTSRVHHIFRVYPLTCRCQ